MVAGHRGALCYQIDLIPTTDDIDAATVVSGPYWIHPTLSEVAENALHGLDI